MINITTWNVLYRSYEEKFVKDSTILNLFPNETDRTNHQIETIKNILKTSTILCLQEVYGDLFDAITNCFSNDYIITCLQYKRVPQTINHKYNNMNEYLITLANKQLYPNFCKIEEIHYIKDGKGALVSSWDDFIIVNIHLPMPNDDKSPTKEIIDKIYDKCILDLINENKNIILCGDFNRIYQTVLQDIDDSKLRNLSFCTNIDETFSVPRESRTLDYILGFSNNNSFALDNSCVIDCGNNSDHNPVNATITYSLI